MPSVRWIKPLLMRIVIGLRGDYAINTYLTVKARYHKAAGDIPLALHCINEVLETEISIHDPKEPKQAIPSEIGTVVFKDVSFSYPDAEEKVLSNISFTAKRGETTAIIGSTGSGKSTLVNLIPRFLTSHREKFS